jgi:hypothetical protein
MDPYHIAGFQEYVQYQFALIFEELARRGNEDLRVAEEKDRKNSINQPLAKEMDKEAY